MARFIFSKPRNDPLIPYQVIDPYVFFYRNQDQDYYYSREFYDEINEITTQIWYNIVNYSPKIDTHKKVKISPETYFVINSW